jgi:hypothetical protein
MLVTTLNKIREKSPCAGGWQKLLATLGKTKADDEVLPFEVILDSNGLGDALWCMRSAPEYDCEWRLFAVWCSRQVVTDPICLQTLDVAERFANGQATSQELGAARSAARSAAGSAARSAAGSAAWSATRSAARSAQEKQFRLIIS